jgi:hypothetical protein
MRHRNSAVVRVECGSHGNLDMDLAASLLAQKLVNYAVFSGVSIPAWANL